MLKYQKKYSVLISCPTDIKNEISIINEVINQWNEINSKSQNCIVTVSHWSVNSYPESGDRAQQLVNKQIVTDADLIVGIFWSHFGTPTGLTRSGTEEELRLGIKLEKDIMLYFSEIPIPIHSINEAELLKINLFKEEYKSIGVYWTFNSLESFKCVFTRHFALVMEQIIYRIPSSVLFEIIDNLKNIVNIYNVGIEFISEIISSMEFKNALSIYNSLKYSAVKEYLSRFGFDDLEVVVSTEPTTQFDWVKFIYRHIEFVASYITDIENNPSSGLVKNFLVSTKLEIVDIISMFVLIHPRKTFIDELEVTLKKCHAFDNEELDELSYVEGNVGWKINQEFLRKLHSNKYENIQKDALHWKNRITKR
ncbi:MAG: hypothetical protein HXX16_02440 [Bacteroidales bacterium]|nr:hypothetical protein [Bacteroidales bacterium]